jgi:hypothetical protein
MTNTMTIISFYIITMSRAAGAGQHVQHPQLRERPVIATTRPVQYQRGLPLWYSLYLLYWYKSTNTDAEEALLAKARLEQLQTAEDPAVYLLYWYKSTTTDTKGAAS